MKAAPVLLFDGDCGFCRLWIERWRVMTGDRVEYLPSEKALARFPKLTQEELAEAVHLVEPDGRTSRGAEAVFRSLERAGGIHRLWLAFYKRLPPFRGASEASYHRVVASHRLFFSRLTRLLWGRSPVPPRASRGRAGPSSPASAFATWPRSGPSASSSGV